MKYGIKFFDDLNIICQAIKKLGYKITFADNGNFVCEKESESTVKTESKEVKK